MPNKHACASCRKPIKGKAKVVRKTGKGAYGTSVSKTYYHPKCKP